MASTGRAGGADIVRVPSETTTTQYAVVRLQLLDQRVGMGARRRTWLLFEIVEGVGEQESGRAGGVLGGRVRAYWAEFCAPVWFIGRAQSGWGIQH